MFGTRGRRRGRIKTHMRPIIGERIHTIFPFMNCTQFSHRCQAVSASKPQHFCPGAKQFFTSAADLHRCHADFDSHVYPHVTICRNALLGTGWSAHADTRDNDFVTGWATKAYTKFYNPSSSAHTSHRWEEKHSACTCADRMDARSSDQTVPV
jgi:hypothetical protein